MNYFDNYGWFSTEPIKGRSTEISPSEHVLPEGYGWNFTGYEWVQARLSQASVNTPKESRVTVLAFLNRFTDEEAIKLDLASIGATIQAAAIRRYLQKVNAATFIDLAREDLISGVTQLETLGILTAGRAEAILNTPVSDLERYRGA